jgi:Cys-tRNA(Pro)/Cys-tRNA(Cys) deacylase
MKDALDVHRSLLAREVPHEIVRLPRPVTTADEIPGASGLPPERCVTVRLYHADDRIVATLVRAGELPHPGAVLAALGARTLRPATGEDVNQITDFASGLVSPVLLPDDVTVLADSCVGHHDVVYTATGDGGTVLGIPARWLLTTSHAQVSELCAPAVSSIDLDDDLDAEIFELPPRSRSWR